MVVYRSLKEAITLTLVMVLLLVPLPTSANRCSRRADQILCQTFNTCISKTQVCNGEVNCIDASDEDPTICRLIPKHQRCTSSSSPIFFNNRCNNLYHVCQDPTGASAIDRRLCEVFKHEKIKPIVDSMDTGIEMMQKLSSAVNATMDHKPSSCPMLYSRVHDQCLAFFTPAKLGWAEARHFCRSLYGDLWQFKDFTAYSNLLAYMRDEEMTSNFWIGGRYDMDTSAWSWATDDAPMPLGAPFWAIKRQDNCEPRPPPHTNPFTDPPPARPGSTCYFTALSPTHRATGWCSAMTYENFHYWSDELCEETFSPLCVFTGPE